MKVSYKSIVMAVTALQQLSQNNLGIKRNLQIARIRRKIEPLVSDYENEKFKLLSTYGTENPNNRGSYSFDDKEKQQAYREGLFELDNTVIEIDETPIEITDKDFCTGDMLYNSMDFLDIKE